MVQVIHELHGELWVGFYMHNTCMSVSELIMFYSSGEEEDPGGGDPLSTWGLCAAGLLRRPCQGQCNSLFCYFQASFNELFVFALTFVWQDF